MPSRSSSAIVSLEYRLQFTTDDQVIAISPPDAMRPLNRSYERAVDLKCATSPTSRPVPKLRRDSGKVGEERERGER